MAMILDPFVSHFVKKLATMAQDEMKMLLGVPAEIKALRRRLSSLQVFLVDAERRQFLEPEIKSWLNQLREVVYDADDILDEYVIRTERLEQGLPPSSKLPARFFHPFVSCFAKGGLRHSVGHRIKELNASLEHIDGIKLDLHLTRGSSTSGAFEYHGNSFQMAETEVVRTTSIDSDTRMLVKQLLKPSHEKNVLVYAIAGMGGIGKTTLAWEIFKHEMIQASFSQIRPVWVCVSKDYEKMTVLQMIIKGFKGVPGEIQDLHELQNKIRQLVTGKKFFLVLDDVWNIEVWDNLLKPCLCNAAPGSRILVTTRNRAISTRMDAERCHEVQKLSSEDSWSLLCKMVFRGGDEREKQNLKDIGRKIVDKCDGLPLALTTIGGVLRGRDLIQAEWEKVAVDSAWSFGQPEGIEGISNLVMGALYVSYEDLPSQIKQCFVYCALFPEDYILRQDMIVPLWIAEGFIEESNKSPMEDTAEEYWKELVRRSLLQADPGYYDQGGCKMHDVVRSLALYLAQDECYSGHWQGFVNQTPTAASGLPKRRRLLIQDAKGVSITSTDVKKAPKCLRTIIFLETPLLQQVPEYFFKQFARVRILDLSGARDPKLPDALQYLIHLRYLNLSRSHITEIPNTIGKLGNLQFLGLGECRKLRILSDAIVELRNLRALDVDGTQLEGMPKGIGKLRQLSRLVGFRANSNAIDDDFSDEEDSSEEEDGRPATCCTLEELKCLTQLKFLVIQNLERISSADEAERAELSSKSHLDDLRLICNSSQDGGNKKIEEVFTRLCPPSRLQRLKIGGYYGLEYPGWMMGGSISSRLPDLKHLELRDCFLCQTLPPLGLLPHLEILHISGASAVKSIGNEFLLGDAAASGQAQRRFAAFPKLKHLILKNMTNWQKWWWKGEDKPSPLPLLEELVIERCGKLTSLPKGLLHNVTRLTMEEAYGVAEISNLPSVRTLKISRSGLGRIHNLPALEDLTIVDCYGLRDMEKIGELQYLKLQDQTMRSLPNWLLNNMEGREQLHSLTSEGLNSMFASTDRQDFVVARKFEFICSIQLLQRCIKDGPEWPKIQDIPYVKGYTMDKSKYISHCKSNPDSNFETNIDERDITINGTKNSSSDLSPPLSIVILLTLLLGMAKLVFDYKSFILPFLLKVAAAIQKFK